MSKMHSRPSIMSATPPQASAKFNKHMKLGRLLSLSSLLILTACGTETGLIAPPPVAQTVKSKAAQPLKPLFCDEAQPFVWSPGKKDASILDVKEAAQKPGATISDIRNMVGDTDSTVAQAKADNAVGVRLCGWQGSTK